MTSRAFHLNRHVPVIDPVRLHEVADVVRARVPTGRRAPDLEPAMTPIEIARRAADFLELRTAEMLGRRD